MHELGLVFHVIDSLEQIGKDNHLKEVSKVTLEMGEVSGVVQEYLTDCWKWASDKSNLLRNSALQIETIEAVTVCSHCQKTYHTTEYGRTCPYCGSEGTCLVTGNEMNIKEIEAC